MSPTTLFCVPWEDILCKKILCYLNLKEAYRIRRVSKQCYELSELYLLKYCRKMDFALIGKRLRFTSDVFNRIVKDKQNIVTLNLSDCCGWIRDENVHPVLTSNYFSLTTLSTRNCKLSEGSFLALEMLVNLTCLDLSHCRDLPNDAVLALAGKVSTLILLNLSHCWCVQDNAIAAIAVHNADLEKLMVKWSVSWKGTYLENSRDLRLVR